MQEKSFEYINKCESDDESSLQDLKKAIEEKLHQIKNEKESKKHLNRIRSSIKYSVSRSLQAFKKPITESEKSTIQTIFRSIHIIDVEFHEDADFWEKPKPLGIHFTVGFKAQVIAPALEEFFDSEIRNLIAHFSDSNLNIKFQKKSSEVLFWNDQDSFGIYDCEDEDGKLLLNCFPILSMPLDFKRMLKPLFEECEELNEWALPFLAYFIEEECYSCVWDGWSSRHYEYAMEMCLQHCNNELWRFIKSIMGIHFKNKFHMLYSVEKPKPKTKKYGSYMEYLYHNSSSDSDFDDPFADEVSPEWNAMLARLNEIDTTIWVRMWRMKYQELPVPNGMRFYDYWVEQIDPERIFLRRRKRKREE